MKINILLVLTLFATNLMAQTGGDDGKSTDFKRFQIGVNFSPDLNYRTLQSEDNVRWIHDNRDDNEIPMFGYTTGLNVVYNFSNMLGVETGFQYSLKGFQTVWTDAFSPIQSNDPNIPARTRAFNRFHYLDIPVKGNITVGKKKVRFIGSVGIVVNVYLASSWTGVSENQGGDRTRTVTKEPDDFRPVNLSPMVSAGIDYRINDKMSLRAEPTFRYGVLKILDTPVTGYLWNAGLNVSWYFGL